MGRSSELTELLLAWERNDKQALEKLVPVVYDELQRLARHYMGAERRDHTLQATALVNEVFIKLVDVNRVQWKDRAHFFGVSAQIMRGILVDSARRRRSFKRANGAPKRTLDEALISAWFSWRFAPLFTELGMQTEWRLKMVRLAPQVGLEPTTLRLTEGFHSIAGCCGLLLLHSTLGIYRLCDVAELSKALLRFACCCVF